MPDRSDDRYLVKSLVHAAAILQAFQTPGEDLRLRDVVERTGFGKGMCFRTTRWWAWPTPRFAT